MTSRVLAEIASEQIDEFREDFKKLIEMTVELDAEYGDVEEELLYNIPIYKNYVAAFNRKYPGLCCHFEEQDEGFVLKLLFRAEKEVKKVFMQVASQIEGMQAIGNEPLEEDSIYNKREFNLELKQIRTKIYIRYSGDESVFLRYNKQLDMVELLYKADDLLNKKESPGFVICAFYAMTPNYKEGLNIADIAGKFSSSAHGAGRLGLFGQK